MACNGPWAASWQFAAFFCISSLRTGTDDSGGAANAALSDSTADFDDVQANAGMILYNLTQDTSGPVTAVTPTTLMATGVTWDDGDSYRIVAIGAEEISTIGHYLGIAASDLHVAMAQTGMCDCTLASWSTGYLEKLNIIDAAAYYQCPCGQPNMTDELRGRYLEWCTQQLSLIREGKLELCHGETGADFPAIAWAEQSLTAFNTAEIIFNAELRD